MAQTPQQIYDGIKILNASLKDAKQGIKDAEENDGKLSSIAEEMEELKSQLKALKMKEKAAKEAFKSANPALYDAVENLKIQKEGANERLVIAMIKNLKDDVQTEIWDEVKGQRKRVSVNFSPKMKKE